MVRRDAAPAQGEAGLVSLEEALDGESKRELTQHPSALRSSGRLVLLACGGYFEGTAPDRELRQS